MDALRGLLRGWQKWHFWVLCPLIVAMATGGWVVASSKLAKEFKDYAQQIESNASQAQQVASKANHPNETYQDGMARLIAERRESVRQAWEAKWNRQAEVLQWPASLNHVRDAVAQYWPIERYFDPERPGQEIPPYMRQGYRRFVGQVELRRLAQEIGCQWRADQEIAAGGYGPQMGMAMDDNSLVYWSPEDQRELLQQRFVWVDEAYDMPRTDELLYAQEDLWILDELFGVVRRSNQGAPDRSRALVKMIDYVRLGDDVVHSAGKLEGVSGAAAAFDPLATATQDYSTAYSSPTGVMNPADSASGGYAYGTGMEAFTKAEMRPDPADMRYINMNFEPLTKEDLLAAVLSDAPTDAYLAVAKRVPIQMRMLIDSRRLHELLAEFANTQLTIEVRQVRFNTLPSDPPSATGGYGYGSGYGAAVGGDASGYGYGPTAGGSGTASSDTDAGAAASGSTLVPGSSGPGRSGYSSGYGYGYGTGTTPLEVYDPLGSLPKSETDYGGYGSGGGYQLQDQIPVQRSIWNKYVEILGIVYIYNPVNPSVLGIEEGDTTDAPLASDVVTVTQ